MVLTDGRAQAVAAVRSRGGPAFEAAFQTIGIVAGRELMGDPAVAAAMQDFAHFLDTERLATLGKKAGSTSLQPKK